MSSSQNSAFSPTAWFLASTVVLLSLMSRALVRLADGLRAAGLPKRSEEPPPSHTAAPSDPASNKSKAVGSQSSVRLECKSGLREVSLEEAKSAKEAWCRVHWESISLRDGPDYRRNKIKRPTASPLLECIGLDVFQVEGKVVTALDDAHADYLPPKIVTAAAASQRATELPAYLLVSISMPNYAGSQADGPGMKIIWCAPCSQEYA